MPVSSSQPGEFPNQNMGIVFKQDTNAGAVNHLGKSLQIGSLTISTGSGAPAIGGNLGDLYIRSDPAGDSTYFYRCTTAGTAGNAVWAAVTGA